MNNPYPSLSSTASGSQSSIDALFLRRQLDEEQYAVFRRSVMANTPLSSKSSSQVRPRRLPTLIKVLTGYDDEPYWNVSRSTDRLGRSHTPVIAYIDKPKFEPSQQQTRKRRRSDNTVVQRAAAAAATALWSQSIRSFGSCRMSRVNSEWDASLRWIAGWDGTSFSGDASLNEWANHFVDDITTVLEACIEQCSSMNEGFGSTDYLEQDDLDSFVVVGSVSSSLGHVVWRSIFGWVFGSSLRLSASFGRLDTVIQIIFSTTTVYAIHSLWGSGWPRFVDWVRSIRQAETPDDWLIQHEKELKLAKSSRARQKKRKKSKNRQKPLTPTKKDTLDSCAAKDKALSSRSGDEGSVLVRDDMSSTGANDDFDQANDCEHTHIVEDQGGFVKPHTEGNFATEVGSRINDGVPSFISLSCATSVTSSPSIKPCSPSPSDVPLNEALENNVGFVSSTARSGFYSQQLPRKNAFAVPTVEQRNEAANQLRDFQNAQIRRLVLQRQQKLAQDSKSHHLSSVNGSGAKAPFGCNVSGQMKKALKPPPGFSEFAPVPHDLYQVSLDENELLLSKLLDDDDDGVKDTTVSLPVSTESSLDPSATPFFVPDKNGNRNRLEPRTKDQWSGNIKGVYGGNVW
ncbi:hypothetical protein ACHAXM_008055 [Skeletonema potamos]